MFNERPWWMQKIYERTWRRSKISFRVWTFIKQLNGSVKADQWAIQTTSCYNRIIGKAHCTVLRHLKSHKFKGNWKYA